MKRLAGMFTYRRLYFLQRDLNRRVWPSQYRIGNKLWIVTRATEDGGYP